MSALNSRRPGLNWSLRGVLAAAALGWVVVAGGCYNEGGNGYAHDRHVYISTAWRPWTVTLKDTRTGQDFWSVDLPVGKQLVVEFYDDGGTKDGFTPDLMRWSIMKDGDEFGRLDNSLAVPPKTVRRLDVTLRPSPELPDGMTPSKKPPMPTIRTSTIAAPADR